MIFWFFWSAKRTKKRRVASHAQQHSVYTPKLAAHIKTRFGAWCFALFLWALSVVFSSNTDLLHRHYYFPCAKRYKAGGQAWRGEGCARAVPVGGAAQAVLRSKLRMLGLTGCTPFTRCSERGQPNWCCGSCCAKGAVRYPG